jgi:hypothetical protein
VAGPGHQHVRKAKLNLVDLAGSERHGKVGKLYKENDDIRFWDKSLVFFIKITSKSPMSKQNNP